MVSHTRRLFQKRNRLTKLQEVQICNRRLELPTCTYKELTSWAQAKFSLTQMPSKQVIGRVLTADCLERQWVRSRYQVVLDQCMVEYVLACESWGISLSGSMIIARAKRTLLRLNIHPSPWPRLVWSWLRHLQCRSGIRWRRAHGEDGLVDLEAVEDDIKELRDLIRTYSYFDVYSMDETGFFFNNVPRGSLCINSAPALKKDKARITLTVCTNATGTDELALLFIGTAAKPRRLNKKPADVIYTTAPKAWVTTPTFQAWLRDVDQSMRDQQRHILILVGNASSHCDAGVVLTNVRLAKLPPNTTFKLQLVDQGIIYCLKRNVLQKKMEYALERIDDGELNPYKVGMLKGIEWCAKAWREMPMETIQHCGLHSTLIAKSDLSFILQYSNALAEGTLDIYKISKYTK